MIDKIEKEFDEEFPFVCDMKDIMIESIGENVKEEVKSFYREKFKEMLEDLKITVEFNTVEWERNIETINDLLEDI